MRLGTGERTGYGFLVILEIAERGRLAFATRSVSVRRPCRKSGHGICVVVSAGSQQTNVSAQSCVVTPRAEKKPYRFLGSFGFRDERKLLIVVTVFTLGRCKPVARSGGGTL